MHDTLTIGIPVFAILAGILFNRSDLKGLRSELKRERDERSAGKDQEPA